MKSKIKYVCFILIFYIPLGTFNSEKSHGEKIHIARYTALATVDIFPADGCPYLLLKRLTWIAWCLSSSGLGVQHQPIRSNVVTILGHLLSTREKAIDYCIQHMAFWNGLFYWLEFTALMTVGKKS